MAKTVIVWINNDLALAVIPASKKLNLDALRAESGIANVRLAKESEFANFFTSCQPGAVPPFGNLFGIRTFVDIGMALQDFLVFTAGTHTDVVSMRFSDYARLVKPLMVHIAVSPKSEPKPAPRTPRRSVPLAQAQAGCTGGQAGQVNCDDTAFAVQVGCGSVHHLAAD
jgi:Ala-tRNA(Pro) deacylase